MMYELHISLSLKAILFFWSKNENVKSNMISKTEISSKVQKYKRL